MASGFLVSTKAACRRRRLIGIEKVWSLQQNKWLVMMSLSKRRNYQSHKSSASMEE